MDTKRLVFSQDILDNGERRQKEESDAEDVDLDAILAAYQKQQEQFHKVTEVTCEPPSPRK